MSSGSGRRDDTPPPALSGVWPPPAVVRAGWSPRGQGTGYLAVPSPADPRLVVPIDVPGADRCLARHGGRPAVRAARAVLRAAHRSGAARLLPLPRLRVVRDPAGVEAHLERVLGRPVAIAVLLGPPRANLKPVLQVFDDRGTILAFAKLATSPLTETLLTTEGSTLRRLAASPLRGVRVPELLDLGRWRGVAVLIQSALPHAQSDREPTRLPTPELAAIATSAPILEQPLGESDFWRRVAETGPDQWHGVDVSAFGRLREALVDVGPTCSFGAWHGDFGPWNAATGPDGLEVWDWERFETDVPVGLDAAHWRVQLALATEVAADELLASVLDDVTQVQLAVELRPEPVVTAACYLLAIWSRYRQDTAQEAGPAIRARVQRLCRLAERIAPSLDEGTSA